MARNKKGSSAVFLTFILAAMLGLVGVFITATKQKAVKSYGDGLLVLTNNSILSEFDLNLNKEYGIFGFYGQGRDIKEKIINYVNASLSAENDIRLNSTEVNVGEYSLGNTPSLEKEILDYMKYAAAKNLLKQAAPNTEDQDKSKIKNRVLRNKAVIHSLPSVALGESAPDLLEWAGDLGSVQNAFNKELDDSLVNQYILTFFKNNADQSLDRETFFTNEVEYILEGGYDNEENLSKIKTKLEVLRAALNAAYLYADEEKRTATMVLAEAITPGPEAIITQAGIIAVWSAAEAKNDAERLLAGKKVPLMKDDSTWATDLQAVMDNRVQGYIDTGVNKGLLYQDYLRVFLYFMKKEVKLARVMDLIQINMKGTYNGEFAIRDYNTGLQLQAEINGKRYGYKSNY